MLERTVATHFAPGTNVKGDVAGANWTFTLPSLELGHIVCLGDPPPRDLATLARLARKVMVVQSVSRRGGLALPLNVEAIAAEQIYSLPMADASVDLAAIAGPGGAARLAADRRLQGELTRVLKPGGVVYVESGRWRDRLFGHRAAEKLAAAYPRALRSWLTPLWSDRSATFVPLEQPSAGAYFINHRITAPTWRNRWSSSIENWLHRRWQPAGRGQRQSLLLGDERSQVNEGIPAYLWQVAAAGGIDLAGYGWGLAAKGRYTSRKVLGYLFPPGSDRPQYIAKLTRDAALNSRLENEYHALSALADSFDTGSVLAPRAAFFGHHGGLAILGQTIAEGRPWLATSTFRADCQAAASMVRLLGDLGERTVSAAAVPSDEVRHALGWLLARLAEMYELTAAQRKSLDRQIDALAADSVGLRTVVQHGDPGPWNALTTASGSTLLLDWEATELSGVPLWDLFYFWRSFTVQAARRQGTNNSLCALQRHWKRGEPLADSLCEATAGYCRRVQLSLSLAAPMFYLCWVHRALKEATRLRPERRQQGHYIRLLRWSLDENLAGKLLSPPETARRAVLVPDA